jgi:hypothetical protein
MKLINSKWTGNRIVSTNVILGEVINILFNTTYYDNGVLTKTEKKTKHNTYMIGGVKYEIYPNIILIAIPTDVGRPTLDNLVQELIVEYRNALHSIRTKWPEVDMIHASSGTTQYMIINDISPLSVHFEVLDGLHRIPKRKDTNSHVVYIYNGNIPVSGLSAGNPDCIYSLSSIVVSVNNDYNLPNGYVSPDFPMWSDYRNAAKIVPHVISYNITTGFYYEISRHFDGVVKYDYRQPTPVLTNKIRFVKWEWLKLYTSKFDEIDPAKLIKGGLLERQPADISEYRCFITGCPIFEDCYVFDFYKRTTVSKDRSTVIEYDEPRCILVSPYYMHFSNEKTGLPIEKFKADCNALFMVYRTRCPTTFKDVIKTSNADKKTINMFSDMYDLATFTDTGTILCGNKAKLLYATNSVLTSVLLCSRLDMVHGYFR